MGLWDCKEEGAFGKTELMRNYEKHAKLPARLRLRANSMAGGRKCEKIEFNRSSTVRTLTKRRFLVILIDE